MTDFSKLAIGDVVYTKQGRVKKVIFVLSPDLFVLSFTADTSTDEVCDGADGLWTAIEMIRRGMTTNYCGDQRTNEERKKEEIVNILRESRRN